MHFFCCTLYFLFTFFHCPGNIFTQLNINETFILSKKTGCNTGYRYWAIQELNLCILIQKQRRIQFFLYFLNRYTQISNFNTHLYRAINNYLDPRAFEILDVPMSKSEVQTALECMEVFLVAYTCFNLNLEFLPKLGQTGNSTVHPLFVIENTIILCTLIDCTFLTDTETSVYAVKSRIAGQKFVISFILEESIISITVYNISVRSIRK
jgi:hypothetical protein